MSFPYFGESHKKFPEKFTGIRILALNTETFSYEILYFTAKTMPKIEAKYYPGKYREYLAKSEVTIYIDGEKQCIIDFSNERSYSRRKPKKQRNTSIEVSNMIREIFSIVKNSTLNNNLV